MNSSVLPEIHKYGRCTRSSTSNVNVKPNTFLLLAWTFRSNLFFQIDTVLLTWTPLSYLKFTNTVDALDPQPAMLIHTCIITKCKTTMYQKSFLIRTSRIWNCLVDELDLSSLTLAPFKSVIFNYYKSTLAVSYDCDDPHSFKSINLKCNSARPLSRPKTCCT